MVFGQHYSCNALWNSNDREYFSLLLNFGEVSLNVKQSNRSIKGYMTLKYSENYLEYEYHDLIQLGCLSGSWHNLKFISSIQNDINVHNAISDLIVLCVCDVCLLLVIVTSSRDDITDIQVVLYCSLYIEYKRTTLGLTR